MENLSNLIFIAVAVAIFAGRTISQARKKREEAEEAEKKRQQQPQQAQRRQPRQEPRIAPLHFQEKDEDDDYIPGYLKKPTPSVKAAKSASKKSPGIAARTVVPVRDTSPTQIDIERLFAAARPARPAATPEGGQGFTFNLSRLTPLQQAVVMAEVLGPPKSLT